MCVYVPLYVNYIYVCINARARAHTRTHTHTRARARALYKIYFYNRTRCNEDYNNTFLSFYSSQVDIKRAMRMFEDATRLVSIVDMFSSNENFEEVATENIKYFLLPALLGKLTNQLCITNDRIHLVEVAEVYFVDFLKRLKAYGLTDVEIPKIDSTDEKKEAGDNQNISESSKLENMVGFFYIIIVNCYRAINC